jgi:hypothetical protein
MSKPPTLIDPPREYSQSHFIHLVRELRRWFTAAASYQTLLVAHLFVDVDRFPTEADLADLRVGQVYRDSTDNTLKVKL